MERDNIAGISGGFIKKLFLLPGMIMQWLMYMFVGSRSYGQVREQTRLARSPLMTFWYASLFWFVIIGYLLGSVER